MRKLKYCSACGGKLEMNHKTPEKYKHPYYECLLCQEKYFNNPTVGVAVIHMKDNKILLGKRNGSYKTDKWCIPCGHLDTEEPVIEGAKREFREETSLHANELSLFQVRTNPNNTVGIYYIANTISGTLKANDDLSEVDYFDLDFLPDMAFKSDIKIIKQLKKRR